MEEFKNYRQLSNKEEIGFMQWLCAKKSYYLIFIFLVVVFIFFIPRARASQISPPVISEIKSLCPPKNLQNFYLKGNVVLNANVLIYINGVYSDFAEIKKGGAENIFYFKGFLNPGRNYEIMAIAQDRTSLVLSAPRVVAYKSLEAKLCPMPKPLPAPTIIGLAPKKIISSPKPLIIGLTKSGTLAHIYIDGVYNGKTEILTHKSGTANFAYKPFLNLSPGSHLVQAIAENQEGEKSPKSSIFAFKVEAPMPAPVLFKPAVRRCPPLISGLAKNNSLIKIFINHNLAAEFKVKNHKSGTANFAYKISKEQLNSKNFFVYATASDSRGKESPWSNIIYFKFSAPRIPVLAAKEENKNGKEDFNFQQSRDNLEKNRPSTKEKTEDRKITVQEKSRKGGLFSLLSQNFLNLAVFLLFVFGIISWVFWVNRELLMEKKQGKGEELNIKKQKKE